MEENTVRANEIEAIEPEVDTEVENEEVYESSNGGGIVAGIVGGFLAYAAISGAKKLATFVAAKLAERKRRAKDKNGEADSELTEVTDEEQTDSEEEAPEEG